MTNSAYKPLTHAEQVFKDLVWTPMFLLGENWLEAEVPVLSLPGVKQLDEEAIKLISDWTFNQLALFVDVTAIQLVNKEHQKAYDSASEELVIVAEAKGIDSDAYKQAQAAALAALAKFGHIGS